MSTQDYPAAERATDGDDTATQQADTQPAEADETETAVDAFTAQDEDDASADTRPDPGQ